MRTSLLFTMLFASLFGIASKANTFEVYCVPSLDGVSTCSGWESNQELQCVSSPGDVASCHSSGGAKFTCTQDASGLTTCEDTVSIPDQSQQNCTAIGVGSFSCQDKPSITTNQQGTSEELDAVSDIIGDSTRSPIDNDVTEQTDMFSRPNIIEPSTLNP